MSYWDSSALLKLYINETDSVLFLQYAGSANTAPVTSRLALYEIRTVLQRKEMEGLLTTGSAQVIYQKLLTDCSNGSVRVVDFSIDVEREFEDVVKRCFGHAPPIPIRTLDAIHLASTAVMTEVELVATDKRLRDAAVVLGLKLFP